MTKLITGLSQLDRSYKGLVVDLWGVMHNGKTLFPAAIGALEAAKAAGMSVTLLSNAPRRRAHALSMLDNLGMPSTLFDDLITSGEVAWQAIVDGVAGPWGAKAFHFASQKDGPIRDGLERVEFVSDLAAADWILNTGPESGFGDTSSFQGFLSDALARNLPMVCANPDLIVQRGATTEICAGALAQDYAAMGGQVTWFGKPHGEVYDAVFKSCGHKATELLAVGDSFKTDVKGAILQKMDVLFVGTGIHGHEVGNPIDVEVVRKLGTEQGAIPTYCADRFAA